MIMYIHVFVVSNNITQFEMTLNRLLSSLLYGFKAQMLILLYERSAAHTAPMLHDVPLSAVCEAVTHTDLDVPVSGGLNEFLSLLKDRIRKVCYVTLSLCRLGSIF